MGSPEDRFLREWHRIVAERDVAGLGAVLAEDVTLGAPPYWRRLEGRDLVQHLLGLSYPGRQRSSRHAAGFARRT